jgi:hypothetical protein
MFMVFYSEPMDNRVQSIDKRGLIRQLFEEIDCHHGQRGMSA